MKITFTFQDGLIQSFPISERVFTIGRSTSCNICVKSAELSREHCRVEFDFKNNIYITDLNSSNGVFIDSQRIKPNVRNGYKTNQQLSMGDCYVVIDLSSQELTRSLVNIRPLLEKENKTNVTRVRNSVVQKKIKRTEVSKKKESFQSTFFTLIAWVLLIMLTTYLAHLGQII